MKRFLSAMAALTAFAMPAFATDVGLSISIGQPGFYGQIDIGSMPQPQVIYAQPVVIVPVPVGVVYQPIYLRVPPVQAQHWVRYCSRYNACGRPVYFVRDSWYNDVYVPAYQKRHGGPNAKHGGGQRKYDGGDRITARVTGVSVNG